MPSDTTREIVFIDQAPAPENFGETVAAGLSMQPKCLPAKFFYDERGSELFERICELPEYYPTRTELALLAEHAPALADAIGPGVQLIEFGAGALDKIRLLLGALHWPEGFTAIDISGEHLRESAATLAGDFPDVSVTAICADYTRSIELPEPLASSTARRVGFFPGSTIGNFVPEAAQHFLRVAHALLEPRGLFLVGVDLVKDRATLEAAYTDSAGVTAAFNLNMLARINRELGGDFDLGRFRHRAFWNAEASRIEMHLESRVDQNVRIEGTVHRFRAGETIHTENSYKYSIAGFQTIATRAGWIPLRTFTDADGLFSLHLLATE